VIANLPYNIATNLLVTWLGHATAFQSLTLMFQREVAERIIAKPGSAAYGRLSVFAHLFADSEILFDIPPEAFVPAPKVTSSVIQIVPLPAARYPCNLASVEEVTRRAFGQRRKMLRSSLKALGGERLLDVAGVDPEKRPQGISVAEFCQIARCYDALNG
jgi:16S rRNA (adenine1518-N6/adenine1519-N6)-dimethyltransferase